MSKRDISSRASDHCSLHIVIGKAVVTSCSAILGKDCQTGFTTHNISRFKLTRPKSEVNKPRPNDYDDHVIGCSINNDPSSIGNYMAIM